MALLKLWCVGAMAVAWASAADVCDNLARCTGVAASLEMRELGVNLLQLGAAASDKSRIANNGKVKEPPSFVSRATEGSKEPSLASACINIINATFDGGHVLTYEVLPTSYKYQEPYRTLSPKDWDSLRLAFDGGYPEKGTLNQSTRVASMGRIYNFLPTFFNTHFLGMKWWLISGTLIGAARTGVPMPWDTDGDIAVDDEVLNSQATIEKMTAVYGEPVKTHSSNCTLFGHGACLGWHVGEDIMFSTFPLPSQFRWYARFIDLHTGFNVEIIRSFGKVTPKAMTLARMSGAWLPVTKDPPMMTALAKEYSNDASYPLSMMSSTMYECSCLEDTFTKIEVLADPFRMLVARRCGAAADAPWDLVQGDPSLACCRKVAERRTPLTEAEHWAAVKRMRAAVQRGDAVAENSVPVEIPIVPRRTSDLGI